MSSLYPDYRVNFVISSYRVNLCWYIATDTVRIFCVNWDSQLSYIFVIIFLYYVHQGTCYSKWTNTLSCSILVWRFRVKYLYLLLLILCALTLVFLLFHTDIFFGCYVDDKISLKIYSFYSSSSGPPMPWSPLKFLFAFHCHFSPLSCYNKIP